MMEFYNILVYEKDGQIVRAKNFCRLCEAEEYERQKIAEGYSTTIRRIEEL